MLPRRRLLLCAWWRRRPIAPSGFSSGKTSPPAARPAAGSAGADAGRRDFIRRYFHHDITDPHLHDLVINVQRTGTEGVAELIVFAVRTATRPGVRGANAAPRQLGLSQSFSVAFRSAKVAYFCGAKGDSLNGGHSFPPGTHNGPSRNSILQFHQLPLDACLWRIQCWVKGVARGNDFYQILHVSCSLTIFGGGWTAAGTAAGERGPRAGPRAPDKCLFYASWSGTTAADAKRPHQTEPALGRAGGAASRLRGIATLLRRRCCRNWPAATTLAYRTIRRTVPKDLFTRRIRRDTCKSNRFRRRNLRWRIALPETATRPHCVASDSTSPGSSPCIPAQSSSPMSGLTSGTLVSVRGGDCGRRAGCR